MTRAARAGIIVGAFVAGVAGTLALAWPRRPATPSPTPRPSANPWSRVRDLMEGGELDAAAAAAREALKRGESAEGNALLGFIQYRRGDAEGARSLLDIAQRVDPAHAMTYLYRGQVHMSFQDWRAAREDFDEFVQLKPDRPEGYALRADARFHQQEYAGAIEDAVSAIKMDPDLAAAYFARAAALAELGRGEDALRDYSKCLELDAGHVGALVNRGNLYARLEEPLRAAFDWERAVALKPELKESLQPLIDHARGK